VSISEIKESVKAIVESIYGRRWLSPIICTGYGLKGRYVTFSKLVELGVPKRTIVLRRGTRKGAYVVGVFELLEVQVRTDMVGVRVERCTVQLLARASLREKTQRS
jgi:hypothetical protein